MGTAYGKARVSTRALRNGEIDTRYEFSLQDDDPQSRAHIGAAMQDACSGIGQSQAIVSGDMVTHQMDKEFERRERANYISGSNWYSLCNRHCGYSLDCDTLSLREYENYCNDVIKCGLSNAEIEAKYRWERDMVKANKKLLKTLCR
ncbi:MAG: hypothetical protein K0B02_05490 [DPANN group archaeon]|nr:hypothetical protein [DPANN group archaeon]